jgi:hypothetical protein
VSSHATVHSLTVRVGLTPTKPYRAGCHWHCHCATASWHLCVLYHAEHCLFLSALSVPLCASSSSWAAPPVAWRLSSPDCGSVSHHHIRAPHTILRSGSCHVVCATSVCCSFASISTRECLGCRAYSTSATASFPGCPRELTVPQVLHVCVCMHVPAGQQRRLQWLAPLNPFDLPSCPHEHMKHACIQSCLT